MIYTYPKEPKVLPFFLFLTLTLFTFQLYKKPELYPLTSPRGHGVNETCLANSST